MTKTEHLKKKVTFICAGNTYRGPMDRVLLQQGLKAAGVTDHFDVESAACSFPSLRKASPEAREAIRKLLGEDLLASHTPKRLTPQLEAQSDLILTMTAGMKVGLPAEKTWTLKEYADGSGDIADPIGGDIDVYIRCANNITAAIEKIVPKLVGD